MNECPYFGVCGGCSMQDVPMSDQLAQKQAKLLELLHENGGVEPQEVLPPLDGPAWGYRHRARLAAKLVTKKGGVLVGFREQAGRYVTDMEQCPILAEGVSNLIRPLKRLIGALSLRDAIPQIEVAATGSTVALTFRHLRPLEEDDAALLRAFEDEHDVLLYLQPGGPDSIVPLVPEREPKLAYSLPDWDLEIAFGPIDFIQVNPAINEKLIRRVIELIDVQPDDRVADLFCGLGNFSLPLARAGAHVTGFELVASQVNRARENAAANGLDSRADFEVCDLYGDDGIDTTSVSGFDRILLDPPRSGAEGVVRMIPESVKRIVYVSCNPKTLARDSAILVKGKKFIPKKFGIVNMFPHTLHAEAVALFER